MNQDLLEEEAIEISSRYNLVQHDEDNISVTEEYIFDDKIQKGIHSLKFNYNDQYVAAGTFTYVYKAKIKKKKIFFLFFLNKKSLKL